ncbi:MAG: bifunctional riboflavin kinase/FAD synthetase [Bdellovibrionales bacterium]|nr:bifunctional riboflavin kinase/FAD synthetase [Bdellovibrionales bacterium]
MKIFKSIDDVKNAVGESVAGLTIGNFDGVHRGHQSLIQELKATASAGPLAVITFDPHPVEILTGISVERIFKVKEQMRFLAELGIDYTFVIPFDAAMAQVKAKEFLDRFIFDIFKPKTMVVGYDFVFGHKREGTIHILQSHAISKNCKVLQVPPLKLNNEIVSSTAIRECLRAGDIEKANRFLGRTFFIEGQVLKGYQRGRKLGIPTANLGVDRTVIPQSGVYTTRISIDGREYTSVTNIGHNPTFANQQRTIETHILDFDQDIYGKVVRLFFYSRVREEKKFSSLDELKQAITHDIDHSRNYFSQKIK